MQRDGLSHITEKPCLMYQTLLHKLLWYQKLHYIMLINSLSNPIHAISVQIYPASSRNTGVGITSSFGRIGSIVSPVVTVSLSENCRQKEAVFFMDLMLFLAAVACALIPLETKGRQIQWGSDAFFSLMYRITLHFGQLETRAFFLIQHIFTPAKIHWHFGFNKDVFTFHVQLQCCNNWNAPASSQFHTRVKTEKGSSNNCIKFWNSWKGWIKFWIKVACFSNW